MKNQEEQLVVRWRFDAGRGSLVWQMMFTDTGDLIGQKRCATSRQALFFGVEPLTGKVFCDDYLLMDQVQQSIPAGESWFTGIETTRGGLGYCYACQKYSPEHQGLWAVDFRRGRVVWSRTDIGFIANLGDEFLVCKTSLFGGFPERHFLFVDPLSGTEISKAALDSAQVHAIREAVVPEEVRQRITLPGFVMDGIAQERLGLERCEVPERSRSESLVYGDLMVVAVHEQSVSTGLWRSSLGVWRMDRLVYDDRMEECVDKPCLNNFLIQSNHLYYVREREELVCVALS
jgi:hypothetical protein